MDAQENTYDTIVSSKLYEQQKYIINTNHVIMWNGVYMNLDFYNGLPADYQALLMDVWENELDQMSFDECQKANQDALKVMTDAGLEVISLPAEELVKMRTEAAPAYDMIRESVGDGVMDAIERVLN